MVKTENSETMSHDVPSVVPEVHESPRFFKNHYETTTTHAGASRHRNGATKNHADVFRFDKSGRIVALPWPKIVSV